MPLSELLTALSTFQLLAAALAGCLLGLLITLLGGGGSLFLFPVLVYGFHQDTAVAAGTSLASVLAAALVGLVGHWKNGRVQVRVAMIFGGASIAGAILGSRLHTLIPNRWTTLIFGVVLLLTAWRMFRPGHLQSALPPGEVSWKMLLALGVAVGLLSGFLGVGGGFLIVPGLITAAHLAIHDAIGTSVAVIVMSTSGGVFAHAAQGSINVPLAVAIGAGGLAGALLGVPLSSKLPAKSLRIGFGAMVGLVGAGVTAQSLLA